MFNLNNKMKLSASFCIAVSNNCKYLCHVTEKKTIVYNFISKIKHIEIANPKNPSFVKFSHDDDYLLVKSTNGTFCIYETNNFELINSFQSKNAFKISEGKVNFSISNSKIFGIAETKLGEQIVSFNLETDQSEVLTNFENSITQIKYNQFVNLQKFHLITYSYVNQADYRENKIVKLSENSNNVTLEMLDNEDLKIWDFVIYNNIDQEYIFVVDNKIIIMDSMLRISVKQNTFINKADYEFVGYFQHVNLSNDGKYIVLTFSNSVFLIDSINLNVIAFEWIPNACFAEFSNGDQYLLIGTWENGYILEYKISSDAKKSDENRSFLL